MLDVTAKWYIRQQVEATPDQWNARIEHFRKEMEDRRSEFHWAAQEFMCEVRNMSFAWGQQHRENEALINVLTPGEED